MDASYEFEYAAFNEPPDKLIDEGLNYHFTDPVRIFSTGPTGKNEAERWVVERNIERNEARRAPHRNNFEADKIAGKPINLVVRKRLRVILAWEPSNGDS